MDNEHKHAEGVECDSCRLGQEGFAEHQSEMLHKHGWLSHAVMDDPEMPFGMNVHTHGLEENFNHPDLQICIPINPQESHMILAGVVDRVKDGEKFISGKRYSDVIQNYSVLFLEAEECERKVLRIICPDDKGSFATDFGTDQMQGCIIPDGITLN